MNYGVSFYKSDELQNLAKIYEKYLPQDVTTLISSSSSGCAIASAVMMLREGLYHTYIYKQLANHDVSGYKMSNDDVFFPKRETEIVCFIDDLLDSLGTMKRALQELSIISDFDLFNYILVYKFSKLSDYKPETVENIYCQKLIVIKDILDKEVKD